MLRNKYRRGAFGLVALLFAVPASMGSVQAAPVDLPGSVQPGRIPQQLPSPQTPQFTMPEITVPAPTQAMPSNAAKIKFPLNDVLISGATVYPPSVFRSLYQAKLGKTATIADLYAWADKISDHYRKDGYLLSRAVIPAQRIRGGVVRIQVIEGFLGQVKVEGASNPILKQYAANLLQSRPLNSAALERYLLLANDLPGYTVRAVITPSATIAGASDLTLVATHKLVDGLVSVDNQGTKYLGPWEATTILNVNDALGHGERFSIRYAATPSFRELGLVGATLSLPLNTNGLTLVLDGSRTHARPGYTLSQFELRSRNYTGSAGLLQSLIRSRAQNLQISAALNYEDSITTTPVGGPHVQSNDTLWVLRFGSAYSLVDAKGGQNDAAFQFSKGLRIANAGAPVPSRLGGRVDFEKLTVSGSRLQAIQGPFSALAAVTGQYSFNQSLLSVEQFGVGGASFGRGYDSSELTGDSGVAGKLELQATYPSTFYRLRTAQFFSFYDTGWIQNEISLGQPRTATLASLGGGFRLAFLGGYLATFEIAKPLTRPPAVFVLDHSSDPKAPRFYFSFIAAF